MEDRVKQYYKDQGEIDRLKALVKAKRDAFDETIMNDLISIKTIEEAQEKNKEEIKTFAINEFTETQKKSLFGGIGIRETNKLDYTEKEAIAWAEKNMPVAIKQAIDKKQFETYAKANELNFVEKNTSITVTFPKELKQ